ncbi:dihydrodipicolinate synthase family protein [Streptomyces sp. NRRL B-24484]|uniref:dihydrodipicolinate synthase family protein n=1 Tax=Streptomyces sp. NRRL B-24484 TaxID=1463833 RepID=UPI0004BFF7DD|nr:dihydrodipicolinate synthase family protein [Streptomyces sp. NRRL B-24484]
MDLHGIHVPLVTPFAADGSVAADALARLAGDLLTAGAAGLVVLGTTGEPGSLDEDEKRLVLDTVAPVCRAHGAPLTVGVGGGDTRRTAEALAALDGVADAALATVPAFVRPGPAGVLAHFRHLAAHSPVPLIVYHIPYRTGQQLDAGTLAEVLRLPGVAGVKYAAGGIDDAAVDLLGQGHRGVMAGDDTHLSALMAIGADGGILASAHLATEQYADLADAWRKGDADRARGLGHRLAAFARAAFAEPNPAVVKGVLHAQGRIPTPDVRLPLLPAGPAAVATALDRLAEVTR